MDGVIKIRENLFVLIGKWINSGFYEKNVMLLEWVFFRGFDLWYKIDFMF